MFVGLYILNLSYKHDKAPLSAGSKISRYIWFPLVAAVLAGIVANLRKLGGQQDITSTAAAFTAATSAMIIYTVFIFAFKKHKTIQINKDSARFFIYSAILTSFTDILDVYILKQSKISYILPILATTPLFVLLVSALFLKKYETINRYTIISALVIFLGVQLIVMQNL
jgi:uncharacterized membrane protein